MIHSIKKIITMIVMVGFVVSTSVTLFALYTDLNDLRDAHNNLVDAANVTARLCEKNAITLRRYEQQYPLYPNNSPYYGESTRPVSWR